MSHLVWENTSMSEQFVGLVEDAISAATLDAKPYFRAVAILCSVPDVFQAARTNVMLEGLLEAMETASAYYVPTEWAIELLTKLCKRNPSVKAWLASVRVSVPVCLCLLRCPDAACGAEPEEGVLVCGVAADVPVPSHRRPWTGAAVPTWPDTSWPVQHCIAHAVT